VYHAEVPDNYCDMAVAMLFLADRFHTNQIRTLQSQVPGWFHDNLPERIGCPRRLQLPVSKNVKYTENGVRLNLNDGLWNTASAMPTYRLDVLDEEAGQVGLLGKIKDGKIRQIEAVLMAVPYGMESGW
jgi:hypothetical protein